MQISKLIKYNIVVVLALVQFSYGMHNEVKDLEADVVIYGGTSAAIASAIQLVRMDKFVLIVCPEKHIGGLSSSGLAFTDLGNKEIIGGISKEFYQEVYKHYQNENAWNWQPREEYGNEGQSTTAIDDEFETMWTFEPHVAEQIFENFIKENNITIHRDKWLDRENGVKITDGKITSIAMLDGTIYKAKIFIDATYEGKEIHEVSYNALKNKLLKDGQVLNY